jgi:flavin reductase (DIM6/NTAB) family NADH-FMN oxidoreductase RutF
MKAHEDMKKMLLSKAFTLMEPGPVVFVTPNDGHKNNIMTISWTMVADFTPLFAITTGPWNYSYAALVKSRECVIAIPAVDQIDQVVGVGTCSGADTDKFEKFGLTPVKGKHVGLCLGADPALADCNEFSRSDPVSVLNDRGGIFYRNHLPCGYEAKNESFKCPTE